MQNGCFPRENGALTEHKKHYRTLTIGVFRVLLAAWSPKMFLWNSIDQTGFQNRERFSRRLIALDLGHQQFKNAFVQFDSAFFAFLTLPFSASEG